MQITVRHKNKCPKTNKEAMDLYGVNKHLLAKILHVYPNGFAICCPEHLKSKGYNFDLVVSVNNLDEVIITMKEVELIRKERFLVGEHKGGHGGVGRAKDYYKNYRLKQKGE